MCQCDGGYPNRLPVIRHAQVPWDAMIYVYIHFNVKFYYATVFLVTQDVLYMCVCVSLGWSTPGYPTICVRNDGLFAYVEWLGKPDYPFEGTPLIVRVRDNAPRCPASKIISIFDIDPTKIIYERSDVESCFYMLRLKGTDTIL